MIDVHNTVAKTIPLFWSKKKQPKNILKIHEFHEHSELHIICTEDRPYKLFFISSGIVC